MGKITITEVTYDAVIFSDGSKITHDYNPQCCENNYADFEQIADCVGMSFSLPLTFEKVDGAGFRFGNGINMVFVPCYSEQNGYYSSELMIFFYNGETKTEEVVLNLDCEMVDVYD